MEILTEFDELQEAMKRINLNESVMPYINGVLCDNVKYNKAQKILDCPQMMSAHKYIYNLDMDQLSEEEGNKIDKLYDLGVKHGFIVDDLTDWDAEDNVDADIEKTVNDQLDGNASKPVEKPIAGTLFKAKVPCWTVIYSATSADGQIKTGEAYSNAISASAAKADVKAKLSNYGYSNITILAIESCEADVTCGKFETTDEDDVAENDMLRNRPHNAHVDDPAGIAEADDSDKAEEESSDKEDDDTAEDDSKEETSDDEDSEEESSEDDSEETSDDDTADDDSEEKDSDEESTDDDAEKETSDDNSEEEEESDEKDSEKDDDKEASDEDSEEDDKDDDKDDEKDDEKEELDAAQKTELRNSYKKTFKNTLVKCKFDTSFNDLTLEQKVKFFTELSKAWKKNEPSEFMTDKEIEQLNNIVVNPDDGEDD